MRRPTPSAGPGPSRHVGETALERLVVVEAAVADLEARQRSLGVEASAQPGQERGQQIGADEHERSLLRSPAEERLHRAAPHRIYRVRL